MRRDACVRPRLIDAAARRPACTRALPRHPFPVWRIAGFGLREIRTSLRVSARVCACVATERARSTELLRTDVFPPFWAFVSITAAPLGSPPSQRLVPDGSLASDYGKLGVLRVDLEWVSGQIACRSFSTFSIVFQNVCRNLSVERLASNGSLLTDHRKLGYSGFFQPVRILFPGAALTVFNRLVNKG